MEGLAPPLACLVEVQATLQNGEPTREGVNKYVRTALLSHSRDHQNFASDVRQFLFNWDRGTGWRESVTQMKSSHRRALLDLIAMGMSGQPILLHLEELRSEILVATDLEIREHMELLPIKMLAPLLLLQFPAFLILLFGPILSRLIQELNR